MPDDISPEQDVVNQFTGGPGYGPEYVPTEQAEEEENLAAAEESLAQPITWQDYQDWQVANPPVEAAEPEYEPSYDQEGNDDWQETAEGLFYSESTGDVWNPDTGETVNVQELIDDSMAELPPIPGPREEYDDGEQDVPLEVQEAAMAQVDNIVNEATEGYYELKSPAAKAAIRAALEPQMEAVTSDLLDAGYTEDQILANYDGLLSAKAKQMAKESNDQLSGSRIIQRTQGGKPANTDWSGYQQAQQRSSDLPSAKGAWKRAGLSGFNAGRSYNSGQERQPVTMSHKEWLKRQGVEFTGEDQ